MILNTSLIKETRISKGWTQAQLAELCAVNVRTIQRVESDGTASLETTMALASAFEIETKDLFADPKIKKKNSYKSTYNAVFTIYSELKNKLKEIKKRNDEIRILANTISSKSEKEKLIFESKNLTKQFNQERQEYKIVEENYNEFKYIKNINSLDSFKEYIKNDSSCKDVFWGDTWAISTIERFLNIKLITSILFTPKFQNIINSLFNSYFIVT